MTWTPPPGNALDLALSTGYAPPPGDALTLALGLDASGQFQCTEANDALAGAGGVASLGGLAPAEEGDAASLVGVIPATGTLTPVESDDAAVVTGAAEWTFPAGSLDGVESRDLATAAGLVEATYPLGAASLTEEGDGLAAAGAVSLIATATPAEAADAAVLAGYAGGVAGALANNESADAAALAGLGVVAGVLTGTDAGDDVSAAGLLAPRGEGACLEQGDAPAATGHVTLEPLFATLLAGEGGDAGQGAARGYAGRMQRTGAAFTVDGEAVGILGATVASEEGAFTWSGHVVLADAADLTRLPLDTPVVLTLGGESWHLLVDGMTRNEAGVARPTAKVTVISPAAALAAPRADKSPWWRETNTLASALAAEAAGATVAWELIDWTIPAERVTWADHTPATVIQAVAAAAGGVAESLPDGSLRVRHRFPVTVSGWEGAAPDHIVADSGDTLTRVMARAPGERMNRVTVRDVALQTGKVALMVDKRPDGLNLGRSDFYPGETVYLLAVIPPGVTFQRLAASHGTLADHDDQTWQVDDEVLTFDANGVATLEYPAVSLDAWTWLGNDLGGLTLEADGRTVTLDHAGVGVAGVSYTVTARAWAWTLPNDPDMNDLYHTYPVLLHLDATYDPHAVTGDVAAMRDAGDHPGDDVVDGLLADDLAKAERARALLDQAEAMDTYTLATPFRAGALPGQLVEVRQGAERWRGKTTKITHAAQGVSVLTHWELLRHV